MNTLVQDFNEFISCRLACAEAKCSAQVNEFADMFKSILSLELEQADLFRYVLEFESNTGSIREECAYKQGLIDGLSLLSLLEANS